MTNRCLRAPRGALAAVLAWLVMAPALAAGPLPEGPGWYRTQIGRVTLTALWDGTLDMPVGTLFTQPDPARLKDLLARSFLGPTMPMTVNAYVVDTGARVVLIDAGTGASRAFGDRLGKVAANLRAAGYAPEQIDEIYLTHMHTDHLGGLTVAGRAVYPRAIVRADAREAGHFLSPEQRAGAGAAADDFDTAVAMLDPYVKSGRFRPFEGAAELAAGVRARPATGHTPGHTVYVIESDGEKLVVWGDLMHVAAVQLPHPESSVSFESDAPQAAASRAAIYREAAREGAWIAAAHIGFPGIGKLREDERGGYAWVPIALVRGR